MVVLQQSAESFPCHDSICARGNFGSLADKFVPDSLVSSFGMVVDDVLAEGTLQRCRAEADHLIQAFALDGVNVALNESLGDASG